MSAYVISEVEVIDEVDGRQYRELAAASIAAGCFSPMAFRKKPPKWRRERPAAKRRLRPQQQPGFPVLLRVRQPFCPPVLA